MLPRVGSMLTQKPAIGVVASVPNMALSHLSPVLLGALLPHSAKQRTFLKGNISDPSRWEDDIPEIRLPGDTLEVQQQHGKQGAVQGLMPPTLDTFSRRGSKEQQRAPGRCQGNPPLSEMPLPLRQPCHSSSCPPSLLTWEGHMLRQVEEKRQP